MKHLFTILFALLFGTLQSQCITGTPPTLNCGTPITVADGTLSGLYGSVSTSAPACRSNEKYTYSDIYQVTYQPGMVIDVDCELYIGFLEVLSADGCTSYNCGLVDASGVNIKGESFVQDGTSQNGVLRFTIGLDDIGLVAGQTYLIKYASIANCGGSTCNSATIGTSRAYTISCHIVPENSCENAVPISGGTTYSITNQYSSDNGADLNGAGIDCGYSIESNIMYRWCTDASNSPVDVVMTNVVINSGTSIQFAILSDDCGADFTDIQCQSGITGDNTFSISGTSASTCYWIALDGNAGTWFDLDLTLTGAAPLPVELTLFDAHYSEGRCRVRWRTATETNNDYFEIQRSSDTKTWEVLDTRMGWGNTTSETRYLYIDYEPLVGVNYYRLRQVDLDGAYEYSKIISVNNTNDYIEYYYFDLSGQQVDSLTGGYKLKVPKKR